ncbi:Tensin-3 [Bagarius yarrelli]|uniref:Tensin-3 n=1 Tax=Bagarius yarrelli TaxID=175774 RepID=A0A556TSX1_BAGYA|nr:Tensin-3 [Bagarius yarrelli]
MAGGCEFDLTYITERIIAVSFNHTCQENTYLHNLYNIMQMLQSKHSENYMVINLSEPREELKRMNIKGTKDRIGVAISSYINLPSMSSREENALDCYTMRRFCSDKMAALMTPSQKRVYQDMQLVCTTGIHQVFVRQTDKVYFALEPPQLLKGDIMIVCYHRNIVQMSRETVFRIQFHTGTLHGHSAVFHKEDLDLANTDSRFPAEVEVEVIFSENMAEIPGFPQAQLTECAQSSVSSDSGISTTSLCTGAAASTGPPKVSLQSSMAGRQPRVLTSEIAITSDKDERATQNHHIDPTFHINGQTTSSQQKNDILSSEIVSDSKETGFKLPVLSSKGEYSALSEDTGDGMHLDDTWAHKSSSSDQTHMWVKQQQLVSSNSYMYNMSNKLEQKVYSGIKNDSLKAEPMANKDDEFDTLALDIDQSIEQLNQLILDLDPEFKPVPTLARGHMTCSTTNGVGCLDGQARSSQLNGGNQQINNEPASRCSQVKGVYDFSCVSLGSPLSTGHLLSRTLQESRGYMDNMTHSSISSDGDLFHAEMTPRPAPCQRGFGSMRSVSTSSPLPNTDSPVPAHSWLESGSNTPLSYYTPQPSPPLSLSTPNAHSSPRALPPSLDVGNLELSLLEAMEGLESLGLNGTHPPLLPQKRKGVDGAELSLNSPFSLRGGSINNGSPTASSPGPDVIRCKADNVKFVQDTSKFWYKPDISREQTIAVLKDKEPGSFIVRDSHSFRGAYGLAMKVATPPPSVLHQSKKVGDLISELVRHFLIECTQKGVRLKGCPNEPYFGILTALVCQHSITPLALPCKLIIPDRACNVWFLGSVELESLTGVQAVQKATTVSLSQDPPATSTIVHFKVLFFRRHYPVNTVIFCALDPQDRKIFGFVARKSGNSMENVCHLFAEHDPEQPASAIVNFVSKVMIGSQKAK